MKHKYVHYHRRPYFPFSFFIVNVLFMLFFGWKLFFIIAPLLMMFMIFTSRNNAFHSYTLQPVAVEKPKRKPKNDNHYHGDYI